MYCENCGCKVTHCGNTLSRNYRHVYKNQYGNWTGSKRYKNCAEPIPIGFEDGKRLII